MHMNKSIHPHPRAERKPSVSLQEWKSNGDDALPFKIIIMILGIIGALPLTWKKPYYPSLHPTKSTLVVAIPLMMSILASTYYMFMFYAHRFATEESELHEKLLHVQAIIISLCSLVTLCVWTDVQAGRKAIIIWCRIRKLYFGLTNRKLPQRWKFLEPLIVAGTLFFSVTIFCTGKAALPDLQLSYTFAPCTMHSTTVFCFLASLWIGCFSNLMGVAEDLNKEMIRSIKQDALTTYKLKSYKEIWMEMRALTDVVGTLNTPVLVIVIIVEASIIFTYMVILYVQMEKYYECLPYLALMTLFLLLITLMVRSTHAAIEQVNEFYSGILAEHKIPPTQETSQRQVIYMYLVDSMKGPTPTFGDFTVVNKALLTSIFGTMAMHLVVLAQFIEPTT